MAREDPQIKLRLSAELKARVEEAAQKAGRSLNAEIAHRLEQSFGSVDAALEPLMNKLIAATERAIAARNSEKESADPEGAGAKPKKTG